MTIFNYPMGKAYDPVWRCIYCGDDSSPETLTKEHIIPNALNGTITLPKSSCKKCTCMTRDFEMFCLHNTFLDARTMLGLKTSQKTRPPLKVWSEDDTGREIWREAGPDSYPLVFAAFDIGRPGILLGRQPEVDPPMTMRLIAPGPSSERFAALKHKEGVKFKIDPDLYARMIAKIAHSFAVAIYGLNGIEYYLPDYIRWERQNIFHYVGNAEKNDVKPLETLHSIRVIESDEYIIVYLTLLYYLGGPTYEVVVGRLL